MRHCVKPLCTFQEAHVKDLGGRNCSFMTALERSQCSFSNKVVCVLIRYEVWLDFFFSLSLFALENMLSNQKIYVVLLFCLCIFSRFTFDFMIFVLMFFC